MSDNIHFNHSVNKINEAVSNDSGIIDEPFDSFKEMLNIVGIDTVNSKFEELKPSEMCERLYRAIKDDTMSAGCLMMITKIVFKNIEESITSTTEQEKKEKPLFTKIFNRE